MAVENTQECIVSFLRDEGGQVPNAVFLEHFKSLFPQDPTRKAETRERFKSHVDHVALVKTHKGVKYVCLRKKMRSSEKQQEEESQHEARGQVSGRDVMKVCTGAGPGSDYTQTPVPHVSADSCLDSFSDTSLETSLDLECTAMGNRGSAKRPSKRGQRAAEIPVITLIQPSPLPEPQTVFFLQQPEGTEHEGERETEPEGETRRVSTGSVQLQVNQTPLEDGGKSSDDDDTASGEGTPQSSRRHFIAVMMDSSPQVRRNLGLRTASVSRSDSDSASIASGALDDERAPVALDPLEHEWMMTASDAQWGTLQALLHADPALVAKKDFVTGFTCLHWAAKQNKPELIALIVNFAKQNGVGVSVDVRSSTGYTPLHVAAMHSHMDVVKLLVGAYNADVELRDYSGRKACQYLSDNATVDLRDIIGAYETETHNTPDAAVGRRRRWKFTKALKPKPLQRLNSAGDSDAPDGGGARESPLRRRASLSRVKPTLQKLRWRTPQPLAHSTTFHGVDDLHKRRAARPKTHFFT